MSQYESIYNLVPREYVSYNSTSPTTRRVLKAPEHKPLTGSTFGCTGTTRPIGAGKVIKKSGAMFGPKSEWKDKSVVPIRNLEEFKYVDKRLPEVPYRTDKPVMGIRTNKNFITANAVQAILQVPRIVDKGKKITWKKKIMGECHHIWVM